ncbi:MAG: mannose-6-phosphate isomerase [Candidatus Vogelbacteria bacterium CG10_big_fil_rev_8_21_14_0_10_49_38]|uniref:Mannose-6-phosphate isomerase n=1 Tax=Candidatus Vogelbacteria bacterium CG10_big_fil_rev_8_21_14_0_10_49_38 TaxID=1975043 RepID=A0A2H0RHF5_9BACT|nr:MAG: mannose-6-phosphate isomerase [bacterium CG10_49_38]PIR45928.1 MAG: mannose-6-phosphate isomerase [Candidatus Vogelbacteria bacterium CG10_big_fil_rev_8_21_14_0_10_49_38]
MDRPSLYREERPWGSFEQFTENQTTTVKIITVMPHEALSLQYHEHRDEFWRVISGNPLLTVGDNTIEATPGTDYWIERMTPHRITSQESPAVVLEIAFGDFAENDNVRISDKYGRHNPGKNR